MLKFFVLSIALAWKGNHFVLHMGNNSNKKKSKTYNFRIKLGMCKWSINLKWEKSKGSKNISFNKWYQ